MLGLPKPEVILTHESDLDGFVSGLLLQRLAEQLFGATPPLETYQADTWKLRPLREPAAWVADFSFEPRLDKANWVILDHHPTQTPAQQARLFHDPQKSASQLCYELGLPHGLGTPALDRLVHLSTVADLFQEHDPDFQTAMDYAGLVKTYQFWNLHHLIDGQLERLIDHPLLEVIAVKRRVEDPLGLAWSRNHILEIGPQVGLVDTVVGNSNLILHHLLQQPGFPFAVLMTLFRKSNGTMVASVRSRHGEALKVAERLQGGGHPNAAGAALPRSVQRLPDAVDYLRKVLNPAASPAPERLGVESLFH